MSAGASSRESWLRKVEKVARYTRMYGPSRTLAKVRGQMHMSAEFSTLPECSRSVETGKCVGIIGCGNFSYSAIAHFLTRRYGAVIRGVVDVNVHRAASLFSRYGADYYGTDAKELIEDDAVDLIYVASNHASHADYAISAIQAGKAVHIEKPHVVDMDQLTRLDAAMHTKGARVRIGFNRPQSRIGKCILQSLKRGCGSSMINWSVIGHPLAPDHWYHDAGERGRVLGNLCHWTDFCLRMVPTHLRYPIHIRPMRAAAADCDVAVNFRFGDGSIAVITFSAKGETFDGVREQLCAQRGNVIIMMRDFHELHVDEAGRRRTVRPLWRDLGHEASISNSFAIARAGVPIGRADREHMLASGRLMLATRDALEFDRDVELLGPGGDMPAQVA